MFHARRRGPASICNFIRAAGTVAPVLRSSRLTLAAQNPSIPTVVPRYIHTTSSIWQHAARADEVRQSERTLENGDLITKFQELADKDLVHHAITDAITSGMGHHTMTEVQKLTINELLKGSDVIAQARTGTGKTLGFLVPLIQNILTKTPELAQPPKYDSYGRQDDRFGDRFSRPDRRDKMGKNKASDIRAIIISPTRELAEQIAVEAKKLARRTSVVVQTAVGGNSKGAMLRQMQREGCHLLVATPGRLNDLLTDRYSNVAAPDLTTLVLDEADRLLDAGFHEAIADIIKLLPDRNLVDRQTMLFSATVPREVMGLVRETLKPDFHFVQTVKEGEQATHEKVPQKVVECVGFENLMPTLLELCKRGVEGASTPDAAGQVKPFKAIVYLGSTANVQLASDIFQNLRSEPGTLFGKHPLYPSEVSAIHGKLSQQQRTRVSERFRRAKTAIMFSSDVTARGMDFPGVTHVIQIGLPPNREQYIHRVGRTGRGSNLGEGWLLLPSLEMRDARSRLRGLPIDPDTSIQAATVDMTRDAQLPAEVAANLSQVGDATKMVGRDTKEYAYLAMLGQMQSTPNKQAVVDALNNWSRFGWGWEIPPSISHSLAHKLGLSRVSGVNTGPGRQRRDDHEVGRDSDARGGRSGDFGGFRGGNRGRSSGGFGDRDSRLGGRDRRSSGADRGGFGGGRGRSSYGGDRGDRGGSRGFDRD